MGKSSINGPFSMAMLNNQRAPSLQIPTWQNKASLETFSHLSAERDVLTTVSSATCPPHLTQEVAGWLD